MFRATLRPGYKKMAERYAYNVDDMIDMDDSSPGILTKPAPQLEQDWSESGIAEVAIAIAVSGLVKASTCEPVLRDLQQIDTTAGAAA